MLITKLIVKDFFSQLCTVNLRCVWFVICVEEMCSCLLFIGKCIKFSSEGKLFLGMKYVCFRLTSQFLNIVSEIHTLLTKCYHYCEILTVDTANNKHATQLVNTSALLSSVVDSATRIVTIQVKNICEWCF